MIVKRLERCTHSHDSQKVGKSNNVQVFNTLKMIYLYAPIMKEKSAFSFIIEYLCLVLILT